MPDNSGPFHDQVVGALARLEAGQEHIIARLDKINGSVTSLFEKNNELEIRLVEHPLQCEIREKINHIENQLATGQYAGSTVVRQRLDDVERKEEGRVIAKETSEKWLRWIWPVIYLFAAIGAILIGMHAPELLKHFK